MRSLELVRRHSIAAASVGGVVLGAVIGLFLPIRAPDPPRSDEAAWSLPSANSLKRFSNEQYQSVRSARFWGTLQMPGQASAARPASWTMTAIATRPRVQVGVGVPGKPQQAEWVRIGGKLPDGSTLIAVNRDTVWYEKDGCKRARKLYEKPTAASEACIGAPAEPAAAPPGRAAPAVTPTPAAPTARGTP
jgi:hypothetical protein